MGALDLGLTDSINTGVLYHNRYVQTSRCG